MAKRYPYTLQVLESYKSDLFEVLIGSEIEPKEIFVYNESKFNLINEKEGYFIRQRGQYIVIVQKRSGKRYTDLGLEVDYTWEAYSLSPLLKTDIEKEEA